MKESRPKMMRSCYCNHAYLNEDAGEHLCDFKRYADQQLRFANPCDCLSSVDMPDAQRCAQRKHMARYAQSIFCPAERMKQLKGDSLQWM